jgi:hypothetical protein
MAAGKKRQNELRLNFKSIRGRLKEMEAGL